ncbi:hypothetical protein GCM10009546_51490 [Actinomadura livida]|uniref:Uncharacterized protein n=1 Tax=Actinomadura livida TaxID=79909 RepID=A0ABN1F5D0_9ACTN|nr:hypothetical protein GCM10010208_72200 [Actinomadura livida]
MVWTALRIAHLDLDFEVQGATELVDRLTVMAARLLGKPGIADEHHRQDVLPRVSRVPTAQRHDAGMVIVRQDHPPRSRLP